MRRPISTIAGVTTLGCALSVAACASANPAHKTEPSAPLDKAVLYEPAPAHLVRYRYELVCKDSPTTNDRAVLVTGHDARTDDGLASTVESVVIDGKPMSAADLAAINAQFPKQAFAYRPSVRCADGEIEFWVTYSEPMTKEGHARTGTEVFKSKADGKVIVWGKDQDEAPAGW